MASYVKVNVDELKTGTYVAGVSKQNGAAKVKRSGWIRSDSSIKQLKRLGVSEVLVDPSRVLEDEEPSQQEAIEAIAGDNIDSQEPETQETTTLQKEMGRANAIYKQAKRYQRKMLQDIENDTPLDIAPMTQLSDQIIDSVFRNNDALSCLTRIRNKDEYLLEHSINVGILMSIFAKFQGYEKQKIHQLTLGALLHDIGKVKIDNEVLNKPGKLTDEEFTLMKKHAEFGTELLRRVPGVPKLSREVAAFHHERIDGTGYPYGLKGKKLTKEVRMISICDVYDAITADRCYKDAMHPMEAFRILMKNTPNHFDEDLVQQFIKCMGLYPVGSLVKLESGKLGVVIETNEDSMLKPTVKVFYNSVKRHHIPVEYLDLSDKFVKDKIETEVKAETYKLDVDQYF